MFNFKGPDRNLEVVEQVISKHLSHDHSGRELIKITYIYASVTH